MAINGVLIHWQGKPATLGLISDVTERKKRADLIGAKLEIESKTGRGTMITVEKAL